METIHKMEFNFSPQHHLMVHELMHPLERQLPVSAKKLNDWTIETYLKLAA
jgi:hypothetical protein